MTNVIIGNSTVWQTPVNNLQYPPITGGLNTAKAVFSGTDLSIVQDGKTVHVARSINAILDALSIIVPDTQELENNPALQEAYDHYIQILKETVDPRLKTAFDSYHTLRKLSEDND